MARFDDLLTGQSLVFNAPSGPPLVASKPEDVIPVLRDAQLLAAEGSWVVGFVSYEAASGLGSDLPVRAATANEPGKELPLVWFSPFTAPEKSPPIWESSPSTSLSEEPWLPDWDLSSYNTNVNAIREQIAAGNTYQCNYTVRLRSSIKGDLRKLYQNLAHSQQGSYNAFLDTGRFVIASASPELFFEWTDNQVITRPMKGTATRGRFPLEDEERAYGLTHSQKDRAENLMIVDLLRNDLGKVAEWGTVEVPKLFELERYNTVWQLTSTITARPRPEITLVDLFEALFPCGSVTGAPKRRTMALIAELEDSRRGVYCGAVGIVAPPGASFKARFNVAIRTVVVDKLTDDAVYGTGGGITWDSNAGAEHAELMAKASILSHPTEDFELFETMGHRPKEGLRNLDRHLARLSSSAKYFGFTFDALAVRKDLETALANTKKSRRVKLMLSRSGNFTVQVDPMPPRQSGPVRLEIDLEPVNSLNTHLYHKTTNRAIYESRASRHPDADDVVLINERGELTETTTASLVIRLDGKWLTPPVESGCLPGVERQRLIDHNQLAERTLFLHDIHEAEAIALVNSLRGWRPAELS